MDVLLRLKQVTSWRTKILCYLRGSPRKDQALVHSHHYTFRLDLFQVALFFLRDDIVGWNVWVWIGRNSYLLRSANYRHIMASKRFTQLACFSPGTHCQSISATHPFENCSTSAILSTRHLHQVYILLYSGISLSCTSIKCTDWEIQFSFWVIHIRNSSNVAKPDFISEHQS